jgi:hypothetical protein
MFVVWISEDRVRRKTRYGSCFHEDLYSGGGERETVIAKKIRKALSNSN